MQNLQDQADINEIFDDIVFLEDRLIEQSYDKGFKLGQNDGNIEAFHLGYHRGAELGAEIGYMTSITNFILSKQIQTSEKVEEKIIKTATNLNSLLLSFPHENNIELDLLQLLNDIRAQFKKLCAFLKIESTFSSSTSLSF